MIRRTLSLITAAALFGVAGCSGGPDSLVKELIGDMNAIADAMEKKESKETIEKLMDKMNATKKKFDDLKLSDDEKKKLMEKHKDEIEKATKRMMSAMMNGTFNNMGGMPGMPMMPNFGGAKVTNPAPTAPGKN
ncbi:MAG TPA: hypothetical protein VGJ05_02825 [Fimbriiglobus sp.]|jgi:peptidoglycan hydrolase CwlO-like protein